jgi:transaldolase
MLKTGELAARIRDDCLSGMTSNPTIFEKALAEGSGYDAQIAAHADMPPRELFELVETDDVRAACDEFASLYEATDRRDGYVSIEVSPDLAHDAGATVNEARRLVRTVDRKNVMVKVPGTVSGAAATEELIAGGVNVNVTLLFSVAAYERVIHAYLRGLERRVAAEKDVSGIASVASFFVSRVDTETDKRIEAFIAGGGDASWARLKGRTAVANARLAYDLFLRMFSGSRWSALAARGARVQRPLWASTSTKNPAYRDVIYVEELIGANTVNTMPPATVEAFRDHGVVKQALPGDCNEARALVADLAALGIPLDSVTDRLLVDGVASFQKSFDTLLAGLERKAALLRGELQASR